MVTTDVGAALPLCARCKEQEGVLDLRSDLICRICFTTFIASKAIKRLEVLQRETRGAKLPLRSQRYLVALSRGPSSTALLHILNENVRRQRERNQRVKFELVVVFVDVDVDAGAEQKGTSQPTASDPAPPAPTNGTAGTVDTTTSRPSSDPTSTSTDVFTTHFPELTIRKAPLSSILSSPAIDWSLLPAQNTSLPPSQRLADFFSRLPSASARADVSRLLIRHTLFAAAAEHDCAVILLGYNTTSLAELTLSEAAKGRGFGIPWFVNDGAFPLPRAVDIAISNSEVGIDSVSKDLASLQTNDSISVGTASTSIHIYSPLREIFRKEILLYLSLVSSSSGPLTDLFPSSSPHAANGGTDRSAGAVVSHRDLSLDDVVRRFFVDVEASYPSVVANVVRTTGKLNRMAPIIPGTRTDTDMGVVGQQCRLCGVGLDLFGDERWKGEIGEADTTTSSAVVEDGNVQGGKRNRLCYGCERSVKGR
ncbi:hypothetical protein E0Z10_g1348 [Xylaria hypoxylon]|uniref:Cytoplasmic tRNA 2-thiolation protein 2 n=1 Tax=Xylaria hypoxylon TaxID=37992 RepID=A0A4Z0Z8V1_9PEZI|nr:hypothetical protein E0Z10_g1348 [Xylaria hypoxylon]